VILVLPGCAEVSQNRKTTIGALGGAAVGGLDSWRSRGGGAGIAPASSGAGCWWPRRQRVGRTDRRLVARRPIGPGDDGEREERPVEQSRHWACRTVTPVHTYQTPNGAYCREYETTITINDRPERSYGRACRSRRQLADCSMITRCHRLYRQEDGCRSVGERDDPARNASGDDRAQRMGSAHHRS